MCKLTFTAVTFIIIIGIAFGLSFFSGQVNATVGPYTVQTNFSILALVIFLAALFLSFLFFMFWALLKSPKHIRQIFNQRRLLAEQQLTLHSLTALGSENEKDMARYFKKLLLYEDSSEISLFLAAQTAYMLQNQEEAKRLFKKLATHSSTHLLGLLGLVDIALNSKNYLEARRLITEADRVAKNSPRLLAQKKLLAIETKDWKYALNLALDKKEKVAFRIEAARNEKNPTEALSLAKQAYKLMPDSVCALLTYLNALTTEGRKRDVIKILKHAWQRQPQPELTDFLLTHTSSPVEALQTAKKIAKRNPDHPETHFLLAKAFFKADLWGEARRQIDLACQIRKDDPRMLELFVSIAEAEGDHEIAQKVKKKAASLPKIDHSEKVCSYCKTFCEAWQTHFSTCRAFNFLFLSESHFRKTSSSSPSSVS